WLCVVIGLAKSKKMNCRTATRTAHGDALALIKNIKKKEKWCGREAAVTYALRQLKFPSSNINKLDKPVAVSTGTFVMHSVIHQCDSCWLKSHPVLIVISRLQKRG
ncbi:hypothetical protein OAT30_01495, partial [bacterium]|nr:hypothetical protein [bacterium]